MTESRPPRPDFWDCMSAREMVAVMDAERWYMGRVAELHRRIAELEQRLEDMRRLIP